MISKDFVNWLSSKGYGTFGTNIFRNHQPDTPHNCITVYDVNAPNISESSSLSVDQYSIKIIVRNSNAETGEIIIRAIHRQFIGFGGENLAGGVKVTRTEVDLPVYCLGKDTKERTEHTVTYNVRVQSYNDVYRL